MKTALLIIASGILSGLAWSWYDQNSETLLGRSLASIITIGLIANIFIPRKGSR